MAADYEIVSQQTSSDLSRSGALIDVIRVQFETIPEGVIGTVTVPTSIYGAAAVAAAIEPLVAEIKAVAAL